MSILEIKNLDVKIGNTTLIKNISFEVNSGEVVAIIGENGVGKTTFINEVLKQLNGNLKNVNYKEQKAIVGYVSQFRDFDNETPLSVYDFLALPLKQKIFPWLSKNEKQEINNIIKKLDISTLVKKRIGTLSGGQRQRVYLAQSLINKPNILLLDEFTSNLDKKSEVECMNLIKKITKEQNIITLCITHELSLINEHFIDKILYITNEDYEFLSVENFNQKNKENEKVYKFCRHYVGE